MHSERRVPSPETSRHRRPTRAVRFVGGAVVAVATLLATLLSAVPATAQAPAFSFADVVAQPGLTDAHARVFRLYEAFFDREPEPGGAQFWVNAFDQCWTLQHITAHFAVSDEFVTTYGPDVTDEEFIDIIYANVLDRTPDAGGRAFWAGQLTSGSKTRAEVMLDFSWSPEFSESLPYPFDGVANVPCDATAIDRPTPGSDGGILAADLAGMTLPFGACFGDTASWTPGDDARTLGDFTGDGLVDAVALVTCSNGIQESTRSLALWRGSPADALTPAEPEMVGLDLEDSAFFVSIQSVATVTGLGGERARLAMTTSFMLDGDSPNFPTATYFPVMEYDADGFFGAGFYTTSTWGDTPAHVSLLVVDALMADDHGQVADRISASLFDELVPETLQLQRPEFAGEVLCVRSGSAEWGCYIDAVDPADPEIGINLLLVLEFDAGTRRWTVDRGGYIT